MLPMYISNLYTISLDFVGLRKFFLIHNLWKHTCDILNGECHKLIIWMIKQEVY